MRKTLAALILSALALSAVGAQQAESLLGPVVPARPAPAQEEDVYHSAAAMRHRAGQAPHWISHVLMPRNGMSVGRP